MYELILFVIAVTFVWSLYWFVDWRTPQQRKRDIIKIQEDMLASMRKRREELEKFRMSSHFKDPLDVEYPRSAYDTFEDRMEAMINDFPGGEDADVIRRGCAYAAAVRKRGVTIFSIEAGVRGWDKAVASVSDKARKAIVAQFPEKYDTDEYIVVNF